MCPSLKGANGASSRGSGLAGIRASCKSQGRDAACRSHSISIGGLIGLFHIQLIIARNWSVSFVPAGYGAGCQIKEFNRDEHDVHANIFFIKISEWITKMAAAAAAAAADCFCHYVLQHKYGFHFYNCCACVLLASASMLILKQHQAFRWRVSAMHGLSYHTYIL